jgi:hypothetical protein
MGRRRAHLADARTGRLLYLHPQARDGATDRREQFRGSGRGTQVILRIEARDGAALGLPEQVDQTDVA